MDTDAIKNALKKYHYVQLIDRIRQSENLKDDQHIFVTSVECRDVGEYL